MCLFICGHCPFKSVSWFIVKLCFFIFFLFIFLTDVKFDIDLPNKKVFIESDKDTDVLLETLKKTGKTVTYIGPK